MTALQALVGLMVSKIEKVHDYIQVVLSDGTTLNIFNKIYYDGGSIHTIEGKKIGYAEEVGNKVTITFEDGDNLSIGMDDDDYNGPEALILKRRGKPPVVWN